MPIGWWRITVLRWVFSRVTSGRLFLRTKRAELGDAHNVSLRSEAPLSSSASWQHLGESNTKRWRGSLHPRCSAYHPHTANSLIVELYSLVPSSKTERDGAEFKLQEQSATSYLAAGGTRVAVRCVIRSLEPEISHPTDTGITFKAV